MTNEPYPRSESLEYTRPAPRPAPSTEEILTRMAAWAEKMKHASAYAREQQSRILGAALDATESDDGDITPIEHFLTSLLTKYGCGAPTPADLEWDWMMLTENFRHMVECTRNQLDDMEVKLKEHQDYVQRFRNFASRYPQHMKAGTEGTSGVTA